MERHSAKGGQSSRGSYTTDDNPFSAVPSGRTESVARDVRTETDVDYRRSAVDRTASKGHGPLHPTFTMHSEQSEHDSGIGSLDRSSFVQFWVPAARISRDVLVAYLEVFVDDAFTIQASSNPNDPSDSSPGYIIRAGSELNAAQIQEVMEDSRMWQSEILTTEHLERPYDFKESNVWAMRKSSATHYPQASSSRHHRKRSAYDDAHKFSIRASSISIGAISDISRGENSTDSGIGKRIRVSAISSDYSATVSIFDVDADARSLSEMIRFGREDALEKYIIRNWKRLKLSALAWVSPLEEDYSARDIASLLLEEKKDGPWIFFESLSLPDSANVLPEYHLPRCSHNGRFASSNIPGPSPISSTVWSTDMDVWRQIESLCGLAGVVPELRNHDVWFGRVEFSPDECNEYTTSVICYGDKDKPEDTQLLLSRVVLVLRNWCRAATLAQDTGLCCDRFTILSYPWPGTTSGEPVVSVMSVSFQSVKNLYELVKTLEGAERLTDYALHNGFKACSSILQDLIVDDPPTFRAFSIEEYFVQLCALATQLICVGFLSYLRAHMGSFQTFFLDTDQQKINLLGAQWFSHRKEMPTLEANLVQLTCIDDMLGERLLAFQCSRNGPTIKETITGRFDLEVTGEDFLDTWGPGEILQEDTGERAIDAIVIRGGYVAKTTDSTPRWHWARRCPDTLPPHEKFLLDQAITIGALVTWNKACTVNLDALEQRLASALRAFGTYQPRWHRDSLQVGFEAGVEYAKFTVSSGLKNIPGLTLKSIKLQEQLRNPWRCLQESWGVQVSLCTGVAQRVRLRELVSELLPCLVSPSEKRCWEELVQLDIESIFASDTDLQSWFETLSDQQQSLVITLTRMVLEELSKTGIETSSDGSRSLVIAWLTANGTRLCLKVPCTGESSWAQVLEDSDDCATFAYVTSRCLTTDKNPCNQASCVENANRVRVLGTAISSAEVEQVMAETRWTLKDGQTYYFNKFDTKMMVQANRDPVQGTVELVVTPSGFRHSAEKLWRQSTGIARRRLKRLAMMEAVRRDQWIRERLQEAHLAEYVFVRVKGYGV